MANQKLNIDIVARDRTKQALGGLQGALGKLRGAVFNLQNAFIGLGAGLVARNLVQTGKNLENLRTRLKFLLKDTNEGAKAFDNMVKFASKVPFSLEEIQSGSGILATVTDNANDLQKMLEITGNVAAVTGLDFRTASEQIQRSFSAGIGAADLFREKGVRNMLGFKAGATVSIEDTVEAFERVFGRDGRFGKATDELAETFEGTLSMIGDKIFNFKKVLLEAGLFESLKKEFGALDKFLEENSKQIDDLAKDIGIALGFAVKKLSDAIVVMRNNMNTFKNVIMILISVKVVTLFANLAVAVTNVAKAMMSFGFATLFTKGGLLGMAKAIAKGGAIFLAFKGMEKLFEDMKDSFENFSDGIKNSLPDTRDLHKVIRGTKKETEDLYEAFLRTQQPIHEIAHDMSLVPESVKKAREEYLKTQKARKEAFQDLPEELKKQLEEERIEKIREEGSALENLKENYREFFENFNAGTEIANIFQNSLQSVTKGIGDAIAQTIVFGKSFKDTFGNIARNILAQLISSLVQVGVNMVLNATIGKKLQAASVASGVASAAALSAAYATPAALASLASFGTNAIPAQSALISTVALSNVLSSVKGFEKGGAVRKGEPILVGERGPEMFVPNSTGQIEQSARGTDRNGTILNFNITATDVRGVKELLVDNRATIVNVINSALNEKGREALV